MQNFNVAVPFPSGAAGSRRVPLGGSATSRSPLTAVAARGAQDNINDSVDNPACSFLAFLLLLLLLLLHLYLYLYLYLLRTYTISCSAI